MRPCIICGGKTHYFFSKEYKGHPYNDFMEELKVDYYKCENCGFVISKTHQDMSEQEWSDLNNKWHHYFEKNTKNQISNQPPYADQALTLKILEKNGIFKFEDTLDYAAGYGTLYKFIKKYFNNNISIFDDYINNSITDLPYVQRPNLKKYGLVINSAMFEHVLTRCALDKINACVANDGILMLHTVICENVPKDPNWFYITPIVHTAFHTNKSMSILMEQWGYASSIYSPHAKSWFLFKKCYQQLDKIESICNSINTEIQKEYFLYKSGFLDYWKGF
ncbi:methyltransferase domain-containing protein [Komagataeibacter sp. FNDCR2]|uniref:methyltransferase domain-containing protein n=1 Tax=Komagataeibacter sp. FNDCR2 TaxID=2878682 RepID=UPI001E2F320D|nr:methyltransferase domain-containing protein [Komagataeibacter sp. FNDCR2]MCE2574359.1 class I SAM-dependent methyltransferase [Komagataeibacter sp. FNDCR2]